MNYDDVFHLFANIELDDGSVYLFEKNEVIKIVPSYKTGRDHMTVPRIPKDLTVGQLLFNGETLAGTHDWYVYSPSKNNCQRFIKYMLMGSGMLSPELEKFIMQDAGALIAGLPGISQRFAQGVTDFARKINILLHGNGV